MRRTQDSHWGTFNLEYIRFVCFDFILISKFYRFFNDLDHPLIMAER